MRLISHRHPLNLIKGVLIASVFLLFQGCSSLSNVDSAEFASQYDVDTRAFDGIKVDEATQAPLQAIARAHFNASPDAVFKRMGDHKHMGEWIPMLDHEIQVDNSQSLTPGENNVGTTRICLFGGDTLTEDIKHWVPGKGYSYSVRDSEEAPAKNHLGVITIEEDGQGGSLVTWRQYFDPKGFKGEYIMPTMMSFVLNGALDNLSEEFGGEVL